MQELGKRDNQEDSIYPPLSDGPSGGSLFILCDGMGGHAAGEVASSTVCEAMSQYISAHPREDGLFDESDFNAALDAAYDALDAKDTDDEKKMGTTLTFVKFHAGGCFTAHIGDSRIYQIRPSEHRLMHVTRDHSLVNDLIKLGEMTPEEAKTSRQKNVITRAVQPHQERRTPAECQNLTDIKVGDVFYLCSDGMLEQAEDDVIVNIFSLQRSLEETIGILTGATKDNKDNHTAHVIRVDAILEEPDEAAPVVPEPAEATSAPVGNESADSAENDPVTPVEDDPVAPVEDVPEAPAEPESPVVTEEPPRDEKPKFKWKWLGLLAVVIGAGAILYAVRPKAPVSSEGTVTFNSSPLGAVVWLDGENTEKVTPVTLPASQGVHHYKLVLEGYETFAGTVEVFPSDQAIVFGGLNPVPTIVRLFEPRSEDIPSAEVRLPEIVLEDL